MFGINPEGWLQFGALGILGLGMTIASFVVYKIMSQLLSARAIEHLALIEALQNNSVALATVQQSQQQVAQAINAMQSVIIGCLKSSVVGSVNSVSSNEEGKEETG